MASPFPKSSSAPGEGHITVKLSPNGDAGLETITYQYPLKLISPSRSPEKKSVLVFLLSYGGGLVGGDSVNLSIDVESGSKLSIVTQGHTKIFPSATPDVLTSQTLRVRIAGGAALCLLPDPVQPFEDSVYQQIQIFRLAEDASLCLLDWVTQGRTARGENWSMVKWGGRNEVWQMSGDESATARPADRLLVRDAVVLDRQHSQAHKMPLRDAMHGVSVFGTLVLRGPLVKALADFFLAEFAALPRLGARDFRTAEVRAKEDNEKSDHEAWRANRLRMEAENKILWSAAGIRGCVVVKFGAATVESGRNWIGSMLTKEGSISDVFGDHALMCVC